MFTPVLSAISADARPTISTDSSTAGIVSLFSSPCNVFLSSVQPNPEDRHGTLIGPSKSSGERAASWFAPVRRAQAELVVQFTEKELEMIANVFERFAKLWQQERERIQKEK